MAHLSSNDKGIETVWVNAAAARMRAIFCNAFEVVVQYELIMKPPNIKMKVSHIGGTRPVHMKSKILSLHFAIANDSGHVKSLAETIIGIVRMGMAPSLADLRRQYPLRLLAVAAMLTLLTGIILLNSLFNVHIASEINRNEIN
ncbi:hypothetical protein GOBAR_AA22582 [Gossypium barbadense]|uniref:Uncharacterized protein n=1 Tax=Gossypium barbadense TaxID=3634 RepID=A0A2P5X418_GOSBA|nr:hypothetical protein GOBAR_AA22582 [Gossypium barbadense]